MDQTTKALIAELHPNVQKHMRDNEIPYTGLSETLKRFNDLAHDAPISAKEAQIILRESPEDFTRKRTTGELPPLDWKGFYKARTVRELLKKQEREA